MCLIALAWKARGDLPLVVAANRDEWRERPTEAAHWWPDHPEVFAGRDLRAGGTWMGVTRSGRFAAVTNFRDPSDKRSTARSRGELVSSFLLASESPEAFLSRLTPHAPAYNGFNLIVGDRESLWIYSSREGVPRPSEPGVHALSNHVLDEPWPKVKRARIAMAEALRDEDPHTRLETFLADARPPTDDELPDTGVGLGWERRLGPPLIVGEDYGTRSSAFVAFDAQGRITFRELTRDALGAVVSVTDNHNERRAP